jgi:hypothetical protein
VTGRSFWFGRTTQRWFVGGWRWQAKQWPVRSRATRSATERWKGEVEWVVVSSVMSGAGIRGEQSTWGDDDRWPPAPSRTPRGERGHQEQGSTRDRVTVPGSQNGNGPLIGGPGLVIYIFKFPNNTQTYKFKKEAFHCSKNIQTLHATRIEYFEQLSQLG